jgi:hypothetical protein
MKTWTEGRASEDDEQTRWVAIGQRLDQRCVGEGEDANRGTDSQREHQDGSDGEGWVLA